MRDHYKYCVRSALDGRCNKLLTPFLVAESLAALGPPGDLGLAVAVTAASSALGNLQDLGCCCYEAFEERPGLVVLRRMACSLGRSSLSVEGLGLRVRPLHLRAFLHLLQLLKPSAWLGSGQHSRLQVQASDFVALPSCSGLRTGDRPPRVHAPGESLPKSSLVIWLICPDSKPDTSGVRLESEVSSRQVLCHPCCFRAPL